MLQLVAPFAQKLLEADVANEENVDEGFDEDLAKCNFLTCK